MASCTVKAYDYSSRSGGASLEPDTVHAEPNPPEAPSQPDTIVTRRALAGGRGVAIVENCHNWTRTTLKGCLIETDGVFLEASPVVTTTISDDGVESSLFQMLFILRIQDYIPDSGSGGIFAEPSASETALPVVTGTRFLNLLAGSTSFSFLVEEADVFKSGWIPGGTFSCTAVFPVEGWMMRSICMGDEIAAVSEDPVYRLLFGDNERILLQQFYDIFIVHDGEAAVLQVMEGRQDVVR